MSLLLHTCTRYYHLTLAFIRDYCIRSMVILYVLLMRFFMYHFFHSSLELSAFVSFPSISHILLQLYSSLIFIYFSFFLIYLIVSQIFVFKVFVIFAHNIIHATSAVLLLLMLPMLLLLSPSLPLLLFCCGWTAAFSRTLNQI